MRAAAQKRVAIARSEERRIQRELEEAKQMEERNIMLA